jgi:hypothetical protein
MGFQIQIIWLPINLNLTTSQAAEKSAAFLFYLFKIGLLFFISG